MPESLGRTLKKIRESRHLSLDEVSERTRIHKKIISDLEEDKLNKTMSPFYAKGFARSYAQFLGALDDASVKEYLLQPGAKKKTEENTVLSAHKNFFAEWFIKNKDYFIKGALVIIGTALIVFSFMQLKKSALKHTESKHVIDVKPVQDKQDSKKKTEKDASESKRLAIKLDSYSAGLKPYSQKAENVDLEITITSDSLIQVKSDGSLLFKGVLKKGAKEKWKAKKEIRLSVSNAAGVILKLNGKNLGSLGRKNEIKDDIVITKDGIK